MLKIYPNYQAYQAEREIKAGDDRELSERVRGILGRVRADGDKAVLDYTRQFDNADTGTLAVSSGRIEAAMAAMDSDVRSMLTESIADVRRYHQRQKPNSWLQENPDGSAMGMMYSAVNAVGCYIPGGKAGYPSTVVMTVVPAQIAGVKRIVLVSPPDSNGNINPLVLACAGLLQIDEVYAIGGAQAIAALAFGTESITRVDKIVGPGNAYVNEAKRQVYGAVGIDSLAGPSEVVILADDFADADLVVRDLFAQAEHDPDARAVLVTTSENLAGQVRQRSNELLSTAPRQEIIRQSLHDNGAIIMASGVDQAITIVNALATEHLQLLVEEPEQLLPSIENAGAIFVGAFSPVAAGDYCGGPNHVLPTLQNAAFSSPLSVFDFMKFSSVMRCSEQLLQRVGPRMMKFAELEGLLNHKLSIEARNE